MTPRRVPRVWPVVAVWAGMYVLSIVSGGLMFGGFGAAFAALVGGGMIVGTTDIWGHVQAAEAARLRQRVRIDL